MNDLLKVLDMSEDEQIQWLMERKIFKAIGYEFVKLEKKKDVSFHKCESLADLAFRLRDEAGKNWYLWNDGEYQVKEYLREGFPCIDELWPIKPIHWVISALIAKEGAE